MNAPWFWARAGLSPAFLRANGVRPRRERRASTASRSWVGPWAASFLHGLDGVR